MRLTTGSVSVTDTGKGIGMGLSGIKGFLFKPIVKRDIAQKIREVLEN